MNRFRSLLAFAATLLAAAAATRSAAAEKARPNVLVIITDQQHAGMLSCAGNRYVDTPAMDSLAATGCRFERAYAANPVCIPSRVSMMSGRMPSYFGMRSNADSRNAISEADLARCLGWVFKNAGYRTLHGGKTHWLRGMTPQSIGFETLTSDQRDELADASAEFLRGEHHQPFLLVASFINPHDICYMAIDDYTAATHGETIYPSSRKERTTLAEALKLPEGMSREAFFRDVCPPVPDNYEVPKLEPECVTTYYLGIRPFRLHARESWPDEKWRLHRWAYCRLTEMVDSQIGRVLDALRASGLEDRTLVVFTSDHGDLDAAHRLEHKSILYEEAARVPLVVSQKGVTKAGLVDDEHLVSVGLDLIPTLCDYAGIDPPAGLLGSSVRPLAEGRPLPSWRDSVVVETENGRMIRTARYKYNLYDSGAHREQLIDLEADPGEMQNLAQDPAHADVRKTHRALLRRWIESSGDEIGKAYLD